MIQILNSKEIYLGWITSQILSDSLLRHQHITYILFQQNYGLVSIVMGWKDQGVLYSRRTTCFTYHSSTCYNLQSCDKPSIKQIIIYYSFMVEKQYNQQELIWIRFRLSPLVVDSTGSLFLWLYMQAIRLLGILSEGFKKLLQEVSPGLWLQYGASAWNLTTKVKLVICFNSIKISQLPNKLKNLWFQFGKHFKWRFILFNEKILLY